MYLCVNIIESHLLTDFIHINLVHRLVIGVAQSVKLLLTLKTSDTNFLLIFDQFLVL